MEKIKKYTSSQLLAEEQRLVLSKLDVKDAIEIGCIAKDLGLGRSLPIVVEIRIGDWTVFHVSLPGSTFQNDWWISRKARVLKLKHHSTLYERIISEERSENWFEINGVSESEYAIHGGGLPLRTKTQGFIGSLLISGLPQIEDHLFGVEVLTKYLAQNGE